MFVVFLYYDQLEYYSYYQQKRRHKTFETSIMSTNNSERAYKVASMSRIIVVG